MLEQEKSKEPKEKVKIGIRLTSMLVDHFIMTFGLVATGFLLFGIGVLIAKGLSDFDLPQWTYFFPVTIGFLVFSIYFNKDAIKGKSPAKRILGLVIVNNSTGEIAGPLKALLRNVTLIVWPIEVIFSIFSPSRRIGDFIAGTKVIVDDKTLNTEVNKKEIALALLIGAAFTVVILLIQAFISTSLNGKNFLSL